MEVSPFPMPDMVCADCGEKHDGAYCDPWETYIFVTVMAVLMLAYAGQLVWAVVTLAR